MNKYENKYVAFVDILGFSSFVSSNFEQTTELYKKLKNDLDAMMKRHKVKVKSSIYSDAIILVSDDLIALLRALKTTCYITLMDNWLVRGGVGYGKFWKEENPENLIIVSEGLIEAVSIEKSIKYPIIGISKDIFLDDRIWLDRYHDQNIFSSLLLHHDNLTFVNPFNMFWFKSAEGRISKMLNEYPQHAEKYNWLNGLINEVNKANPLVPEHAVERLLRSGELKITD